MATTIFSGSGRLILGNNLNESITGTSSNDTIYGYAGSDSINGSGGNDYIDGGLGSDNLVGGTGNNTLIGGAGNDFLDGSRGTNDVIIGGAGFDTAIYSSLAGFNTAAANGVEKPSLAVSGTPSSDNIIGLNIDEFILGLAGDDSISGNGGNDLIFGNEDNDTLTGGDGNDQLFGGKGNDFIFGEAGNDLIVSGDNSDTITGGSGNDTFAFGGVNSAVDTITDFSPGDIISLSANPDPSGARPGLTGFNLLGATNPLIPNVPLVINQNLFIGSFPALVAGVTNSSAGVANGPIFIYDTSANRLLVDSNGQSTGSVLQLLAVFLGVPTLGVSDFIVPSDIQLMT